MFYMSCMQMLLLVMRMVCVIRDVGVVEMDPGIWLSVVFILAIL